MTKRAKPRAFLDRLADVRGGEDACWPWPTKLVKGYGRVFFEGRYRPAHCATYEVLVGPIPLGKTLDHLCRNRACVNPNHLEPVTSAVNVLRGIGRTARQKRQTECKRGHPLSGENLYRWRNSRICRECQRQRQHDWDNRDPAATKIRRAKAWQLYRKRHLPVTRPQPRPGFCGRGHAMTPENTYEFQGHHACRTCRRERERERRAERSKQQ